LMRPSLVLFSYPLSLYDDFSMTVLALGVAP